MEFPFILFNFFFSWQIHFRLCIWMSWIFIAARGLSRVAASGGYSLVVVHGLLIDGGFSWFGAWALECGLSSCGEWA